MVEIVSEKQNYELQAPVATTKQPVPPRAVIQFGRAIIILVETSQRTIQLFQESIHQLRDFIEAIRDALQNSLPSQPTEAGHDFDVNLNRSHGELKVKPWDFVRVPKMRACKVTRQNTLNNSPAAKAFEKIVAGTSDLLGANIENGANCCYIASVIQALRMSKSFRCRIRSRDLKTNPIVQELKKLYNIIEGKGRELKRTVTASEIEHFRRTLINAGLVLSGLATGNDSDFEDASEVCQFILDNVGLKPFLVKEHSDHSFDIPVSSLNPPASLVNLLQLGIGENRPEDKLSEIRHLINKRSEPVSLEPNEIRICLNRAGTMKPEYEEKLQKMEAIVLVPVAHTYKLFENQIPSILHVGLSRRYGIDYSKGIYGFNTIETMPNEYLDIPLEDKPGFSARFKFTSAVSFDQQRVHYSAWTTHQHKGQTIYGEFDSLKNAVIHCDATIPQDTINKTASSVLYEFVDVRPTAV